MFNLNVALLACVSSCGANLKKAFNNTLRWDSLYFGCHSIHNRFTASFIAPKTNGRNRAQTEATECKTSLTGDAYDFFYSMH